MRALLLSLALLAGCSENTSVADAIGNAGQAGDPRPPLENTSGPLDPGIKPVTIGEGGPNFPACSGLGRVVSAVPLPVRGAPFAEAAEIDGLAPDTRVIICTRTLDQRWLGVVYPPAGVTEAQCGLAQPADRRRGYEGPCRSGWVASAAVRLIGR
jgi:hypothetical protein